MSDPTPTSATRTEVELLHKELGSVSTPDMHGDNLAILLCSFFEDDDTDNGWTDAALARQEAVLAAIRGHYEPGFSALREKLEAAEAAHLSLCEAIGVQATALACLDARAQIAAAEAAGFIAGRDAGSDYMIDRANGCPIHEQSQVYRIHAGGIRALTPPESPLQRLLDAEWNACVDAAVEMLGPADGFDVEALRRVPA